VQRDNPQYHGRCRSSPLPADGFVETRAPAQGGDVHYAFSIRVGVCAGRLAAGFRAKWRIVCFVAICAPGLAAAQAAAPPQAQITLPNGTAIQLQLAHTISTATATVGQPVAFVVVEDVVRDGVTVIPSGTAVTGTVAEVRRKLPAATPDKLALSVDSLTLDDGQTLGLHGEYQVQGHTRFFRRMAGLATDLMFLPAVPGFSLVRGDGAVALKSTEVTAYVQNETTIATSIKRSESGGEFSHLLTFLPTRVLNRQGRAGDMVNLVLVAAQDDLQRAFTRAGWLQVDMSKPKIAWGFLQHGVHYAKLPMAHFFLYGRSQDYSYSMPNPMHILSQRHHLRVWRTDCKVNGTPVWVAAATHDVAIEMNAWKLHLTHRIDPQVDAERDFIAQTLEETLLVRRRDYLTPPKPVYEGTTTGGQPYFSDSRLVLIELHTSDQTPLRSPSWVTLPVPEAESVSGLHRAEGTAAGTAPPGLASKASAVARQ
jgi:LssY C-terminus